jgi:hypothetical protein
VTLGFSFKNFAQPQNPSAISLRFSDVPKKSPGSGRVIHRDGSLDTQNAFEEALGNTSQRDPPAEENSSERDFYSVLSAGFLN